MDQYLSIDGIFASCFFFTGLLSVAFLTYVRNSLPNERSMHALWNCAIPKTHLATFLLLMAIPAYYFFIRNMPYSSSATLHMAIANVIAFHRLSIRARRILHLHRYI